MKNLVAVAVCATWAFTACGPVDDVSEATGADAVSAEQEIIGLSPSSDVAAIGDRHLKNTGANNCAWQNGPFVNTDTCNTTNDNQLFSIYKYKADGRVMGCSKTSLKETSSTETCTKRYYSASGTFLSSKEASCYLSRVTGSCMTTGNGTDVRLSPAVIEQTYFTECNDDLSVVNCRTVQKFYDGKLRRFPLNPNTLFTVEGARIKANNGKYLKRLNTNIVTAETLVATDNNFNWLLY